MREPRVFYFSISFLWKLVSWDFLSLPGTFLIIDMSWSKSYFLGKLLFSSFKIYIELHKIPSYNVSVFSFCFVSPSCHFSCIYVLSSFSLRLSHPFHKSLSLSFSLCSPTPSIVLLFSLILSFGFPLVYFFFFFYLLCHIFMVYFYCSKYLQL